MLFPWSTWDVYGPSIQVTFPTVASITEALQLQVDIKGEQAALANIAGTSLNLIPAVGGALASLVVILVSINYSTLQDKLLEAKADRRLVMDNIINMKARMNTIKDYFQALQRNDLTREDKLSFIVYILGEVKTILYLFEDEEHILYRYPLQTTLFLGVFSNVAYGTLKYHATVDLTDSRTRKDTRRRISDIYVSYISRFLHERQKGITVTDCGPIYGHKNVTIVDEWNRDQCSFYPMPLPYNCKPIGRCVKYYSTRDYKSKQAKAYTEYLLDILPPAIKNNIIEDATAYNIFQILRRN